MATLASSLTWSGEAVVGAAAAEDDLVGAVEGLGFAGGIHGLVGGEVAEADGWAEVDQSGDVFGSVGVPAVGVFDEAEAGYDAFFGGAAGFVVAGELVAHAVDDPFAVDHFEGLDHVGVA